MEYREWGGGVANERIRDDCELRGLWGRCGDRTKVLRWKSWRWSGRRRREDDGRIRTGVS